VAPTAVSDMRDVRATAPQGALVWMSSHSQSGSTSATQTAIRGSVGPWRCRLELPGPPLPPPPRTPRWHLHLPDEGEGFGDESRPWSRVPVCSHAEYSSPTPPSTKGSSGRRGIRTARSLSSACGTKPCASPLQRSPFTQSRISWPCLPTVWRHRPSRRQCRQRQPPSSNPYHVNARAGN
jgi:hypothetical protein